MKDAIMIFQTLFFNIHWVTVIGTTVAAFLIGVIWHLPFLFGKIRDREAHPDGARTINKPVVFILTLLFYLIAFANLSLVVSGTGAISGLLTSLQISIVWVATAIGVTYLYAGRSWRLIAIDSSLYVVLFSFGGLALAIW